MIPYTEYLLKIYVKITFALSVSYPFSIIGSVLHLLCGSLTALSSRPLMVIYYRVNPWYLIISKLGYSSPKSRGPILNCSATYFITSNRVRFEANLFSKIFNVSSPMPQLLYILSQTEERGIWELWALKDPTPKY